jgi:hypothetical protein
MTIIINVKRKREKQSQTKKSKKIKKLLTNSKKSDRINTKAEERENKKI